MVREHRKTRLFYLTALLDEPKLVKDIPHPVSYNCLIADLLLLQKEKVVSIKPGRTEKVDRVVRERPVTMEELSTLFPRVRYSEDCEYQPTELSAV